MQCMVCRSPMAYFFTKQFDCLDLGAVDYWRCPECGFCASKTHLEMSAERWERLNDHFHAETHHRTDNPYNRNQRYFNQALMLFLVRRVGIVKGGRWLDWGCGVGALAILLKEWFNIELLAYDAYCTPKVNVIDGQDLLPGAFNLVVNTAVFEHIRRRATLDRVESYVHPGGCFAVHTLVREEIPKDPGWMYLLPVHCAFFTNRAMQLLMDQWGYTCSVYNEHAKMWVLFPTKSGPVESRAGRLNGSLGWEYLHFKRGFMDYWK